MNCTQKLDKKLWVSSNLEEKGIFSDSMWNKESFNIIPRRKKYFLKNFEKFKKSYIFVSGPRRYYGSIERVG